MIACLFALICGSSASGVRADPATLDRFVVVLKPGRASVEDWPSGTRAVISELVARGYELVVRSSTSKDLEGLRRELELAATDPSAVGSVAVFRSDATGIALVYTTRSGVVSVDADTREGTLSESSVALRVSELFRDHEIASPPAELVTPSDPAPAPPRPDSERPSAPARDRATGAVRERPRDIGALFLKASVALSGDLDGALPLLGVGATSPHLGPLALDLVFATSPGSADVATRVGEARLAVQSLRSHLLFDPWFTRETGLTLGLGGGVVWTQASAAGEGTLAGRGDETEVALLSARIAAFVRSGRFRFDLALEPGLMLPELVLRADDERMATVGRPWTEVSATLGWAL